jgi:hypothetical protein
MKVIDLLNKIANGEEVPKKFTYKGYLWEYDVKNKMWFYYFGEGKNHRFDRLFYLNMILNDEVKIIEEPKEIEKIGSWYEVLETESKKTQLEEINHNFNVIFDRLETLIDVVNELKKENK